MSLPPPTPAETPRAKDSLWQRLSGPPRRSLPAGEVKGLGALGALLVLATGAADWHDARAVLILSVAWLVYGLAVWVRRRLG